MPNSDMPDRDKPVRDVIFRPLPMGTVQPLILASPHSGSTYAPAFLEQCRLPLARLRSIEDFAVDQLIANLSRLGVAQLVALFPRIWIDVNRGLDELDPAMIAPPLPKRHFHASERVQKGIGLIHKLAPGGDYIYASRLAFSDIEARILTAYLPYHAALQAMIDANLAQFGSTLVIDCHSMPSAQPNLADFVLGDDHSQACAPVVTSFIENFLQQSGYVVARNHPYAGGFCTTHYGKPNQGVHFLQLEINRALYMDEERLTLTANSEKIIGVLESLVAALIAAMPNWHLGNP